MESGLDEFNPDKNSNRILNSEVFNKKSLVRKHIIIFTFSQIFLYNNFLLFSLFLFMLINLAASKLKIREKF